MERGRQPRRLPALQLRLRRPGQPHSAGESCARRPSAGGRLQAIEAAINQINAIRSSSDQSGRETRGPCAGASVPGFSALSCRAPSPWMETMTFGTELLAFAVPPQGDSFVRPVPCPEIPAMQASCSCARSRPRSLTSWPSGRRDGNCRARYAVLFAAKEAGSRIWGDHQAEALGKNERLLFLVERINYNGRLHNGLTIESRELVEKNSEPGRAMVRPPPLPNLPTGLRTRLATPDAEMSAGRVRRLAGSLRLRTLGRRAGRPFEGRGTCDRRQRC